MADDVEKTSEEDKEKEKEEGAATEGGEGEGEEGASPKNAQEKKPGINILLIIIIALLVIILGAGGFLLLTSTGQSLIGLGPSAEEMAAAEKEEEEEVEPPTDLVYFNIPELLVNLTKSSGKQKTTPFLRLSLKLELPDKESDKTMQAVLPRVIDQFQVYLRQLRVEDIEGSAGIQRLREELLKRVNEVAAPVKVKDVLFEVMLVQ